MKKEKENTPKLWNDLWKDIPSIQADIDRLKKEDNSIRYQRIKKILLREFGSFQNLKVIEIGSGFGTYAALMAEEGAEVTILDYSDIAIERARNFFKRNKISAEFIKQDALSLSTELLNKYDISMSFGLAEHFRNSDRIKINKVHFDLLKEGGIALISVPNKHNLPYRMSKFLAEHTQRWKYGEEYPYSRKEFRNICQEIGINEYSFIGDSFVSSLNFLKPFRIIFRIIYKLERILGTADAKKERGTFLDEYLSYALVLCGKKQKNVGQRHFY